MRRWSAYVSLVVLTSGFAAHLGCGGDEPAGSTPGETDGGADTTADAGPGQSPGPEGGPGADDAGADDAGADAGPTEAAQILGYVFSNSPAEAESTPSAAFSYNAAGGPMKVTRTGAGQYTVTFTGLGLAGSGVALASAYDTQGGLCHWSESTGEDVKVRCVNAAGSNSDSKFALTVFGKGKTPGATILGFAVANDKTNASYTPQGTRSNNGGGGGAITASRVAPGTYKMEFGGLALDDIENVQVMPYGDVAARCVVKSWGGPTVSTYCYDGAGALADAQYAVLIVGKKPGGTARVVAYAHANDSASASYAPALLHNEGDGGATATRSAPGTYSMAFDGRNLNSGAHVQVSAQGQGRRCNVTAWAGTTVNLTCTSGAGSPTDNNYAIVVLQ